MSIYKDVKFQFLEIAPPTTSDKALKVSGTAEITGALTLSSDLAVVGNTTITGNLTVDGTTTTVNSTVVDVVDPIMTIGANASDDNKDRGLVFKYNDGAAKLGFIGYDNSLSQFSMMTTVTNSSEVVSGTLGTLQIAGISATSSTFDLDSANAMSLNSSGGAINVGNDDIDQAINIGTQGERTISIGTGAFADTINIGNATGATAVSITAGTGGVPITSDTATTGHAVSITADALTSGSALDITSTSAGKTTGGLVNIAHTGVNTTQEAPSMTVSTSATTHANAGIASFTGNALTVGDAVSISANALTSGSALDISATNASLTGPVINITGGSATANEYTAFTPIYQQINSVQRGNIKFSWTASATASEVDVGVDLPFTTGVCVVTDIFIITTNATNTPTIDLGLLSTETNGDADGFLDGVTQSATGVQSVYTNDFKGAFNTDSGDSIPTRWNCPFNASTGQARSISMTLSATGSVGTIIMEYIAIDV